MIQNFGPGDKIVSSTSTQAGLFTHAVRTTDGYRKVLLVNKTFDTQPVNVSADALNGRIDIMDIDTRASRGALKR